MTRALLLLAVVVVACSRDTEPNEGKRIPKLPPSADVVVPTTLSIEVTIDGAPAPAITAATLTAHAPDFVDRERRAWRIATLVPDAARPGTKLSATGDAGVTVELAATADGSEAPVAVLYLTRRGDALVALVDARDPFPRYHGQGRRLGRPGDPMPRVADVRRIAIQRTPPR